MTALAHPERLHFRCTEAEKRDWRQAAQLDGRTLSSWMRHRLNQAAGETEQPTEAKGGRRE